MDPESEKKNKMSPESVGLQEKLFTELENKEIFERAKEYAYDYICSTKEAKVVPTSLSLDALSCFDEPLPEESSQGCDVLRILHEFGSNTTTRSTGGRYFGFVNGGVLPVAAASRWLSDVWDQNCALCAMSPIASKLEAVLEDWIIDLLGLEEGTAMGLVGGSSVATLCGLAAARNSILLRHGWNVMADGLFGAPTIRVIMGEEAHGSVYKAISILGLGKSNVELAPCDSQGRIIVDKLPPLDSNVVLILSAGQVCTGAFDDIDRLCDLANAAKAWVHVDGAFGLWAAASSKTRFLTKGIEKAHSLSVDGHKTLNTPYDCGLVLCKDRQALRQAMAAEGSYLVESESSRDGMFYSPDMSRRARSVDLWTSVKYLGRSGIERLVNLLVENAQRFECLFQQHSQFEVLNDVVFNQCLVRCSSPEKTLSTLSALQESGLVWCGGSTWFGEPAIRISCCSWATTADDIAVALEVFLRSERKSHENLDRSKT